MSSVDGSLFHTGYSKILPVDVAAFLKRSFTNDEKALVVSLINQIEYEVASRCHRNFNTDLVYYDFFGSGYDIFTPFNTPVASLEAIYIDGVNMIDNYTENVNYWIDTNQIIFASPVTSSTGHMKSVKLEYKIKKFWGDDVVRMITQWVGYAFLSSENGGVATTSLSFADLSQNFDVDRFTKERDALIYSYTDILI